MSTFGFPQSFAIELTLASDSEAGSSDAMTRGRGLLTLGGERVWPPSGPDSARFEWTWIEMLEHLAMSWPQLMWEEGIPFGLRPSDAEGLWQQLEDRIENELIPEHETDRAMAVLEDFLQTHDLSLGVQGAVLPSFVLVRDGRSYWLCAPGRVERHSEQIVIRALEELCDHLVDRLSRATDDRAAHAIQAWHGRLDRSPLDRIAITTGRPRDELQLLSREGDIEDFWDLDRTDPRDANELLAVARSATTLSTEALRSVLEQVRQQTFVDRQDLDQLALKAQFELAEVSRWRPHEQGYSLARWLRATYLTAESVVDSPMDPEAILAGWGIDVIELSGNLPNQLDAVSCWGELRGPTIFINPTGLHAGSPAGLRTTLAHEICHLLVDRRGALPFAEVLTTSSTGRTESRASAFAAELLIPQAIAAPALSGEDYEAAFKQLRDRFGASSEVIAWQAKNGGALLDPAAKEYLSRFVSHPERF